MVVDVLLGAILLFVVLDFLVTWGFRGMWK
jgi:hypothetical protein